MIVSDIAACCKKLRLSRNIVEMSGKIQADSHQEYLLKLLQSEITHREKARRDKLIKKAGFYTIKTFESFRFDEVTLPVCVCQQKFDPFANEFLTPQC